jgi:tRNA pseudouridine55 synthase
MGDLRRTGTDPFDDSTLVTMEDFADGLARWEEEGDADWLREVVEPAEEALTHLPAVTIAPSAAEEVAHGAQVYAPGVIEAEDAGDGQLVACFTPGGAAVCLGTMVGDSDAEEGVVVELERVLV